MGESDTAYWIAFSRVPHVGAARARRLAEHFGSLAAAWEANAWDLKAAGMDDRVIGGFDRVRRTLHPEGEMETLRATGIGALALPDPAYPARLRDVPNPPMVLYVRGEISADDDWAVGVVGTRRASPYGRQVAATLAGELAASRVTVVSGLARGVDAVAHKAALDAGGRSICVLGSGVDQLYPWDNRHLAERMVNCGAIVSEYPPGTKPDARNFPPRNRIITGLSLGLVIVEGDMKSGAMISAGFAAEQNRPLFAVPGPITSALSEGAHYLIRLGAAKLVSGVEDVLEELDLRRLAVKREAREIVASDPTEAVLLGRLSADAVHVDELARASGLPIAVVSGTLTLMELKGMVRSVGAMQYVRA